MKSKIIKTILILLACFASYSSFYLPISSSQAIEATAEKAPLLTWFGEKHSTELNLVGGKGASLSILQSIPGIYVPEGFIVTTNVYDSVVKLNKSIYNELLLLDELSCTWIAMPQNSDDLAAQISKQSQYVYTLIKQAAIPSDFAAEIVQQYKKLSQLFAKDQLPVAIRSSATAEDLVNASFAGQHDTFLNQIGDQQVLESIKACWASLFHPHTVQYRNQLRRNMLSEDPDASCDHLKHTQVALAVVVQRVIEPKAAGVAFNVSPTGQPLIQIEANLGFGETVVGGLATPDSWQVDKTGTHIISRKLGEKAVMTISKEQGDTELAPVPEQEQKAFVLNDSQILHIAKAVHDIGQYYAQFIDTEFAVDHHGKLYFLQARPETVFSSQKTDSIMGISPEVWQEAEIIYHGGAPGFPGAYSGRLVYSASPDEALAVVRPGDILVTQKTEPTWSIIFPKLGGIIVDTGGALSHTAIVGREMHIPTILAASGASNALLPYVGQEVTIDSTNGIIYKGRLDMALGSAADFVRHDLHSSPDTILAWPIKIAHTDDKGQWSCRQDRPFSTFQLQFFLEGFTFVNERLQLTPPIETKVINNVLYFKIADAQGPTSFMKMQDVLSKWDFDRLEELFEQRVEAVDNLMAQAVAFDLSPASLQAFKKAYQEWINHLLIRGRFGHGTIALLLQQEMHKIPNQAILSQYLDQRFPIVNETHKKQQEHTRLVQALQAVKFSGNDSLEDVKSALQTTYPSLWQEIVIFATSYEHVDSEDIRTPIPLCTVLHQLLRSIGKDHTATAPLPLTSDQIKHMDELFQQDQKLARIMILAHRHLYQKEKEHHWIYKSQAIMRQKLEALGQQFVEKGIIKTKEEIFNLSCDEIISKLSLRHSR